MKVEIKHIFRLDLLLELILLGAAQSLYNDLINLPLINSRY